MMLERQLSELTQMLLADDPKRGCQRALQVLAARNAARTTALFTLAAEQQRLRLFASEGIDQAALDMASSLFARHRRELAEGGVVRHAAAHPLELSAVLTPVQDNGELVAAVYLDSAVEGFLEALDVDGVKGFSSVLAAAVTQAANRPLVAAAATDSSYLADTPPDDVRRDQLLVLLERHEWNVARVARAMGCARMTIYSWLARYGIERRRIRKTRPRVARAG